MAPSPKKTHKAKCGRVTVRRDRLEHQVICGDCIEMMRKMRPHSVDLIVTSPPYNAQKSYEKKRSSQDAFRSFSEAWLSASYPLLRQGGSVFINVGYWSGSRKERFFLPSIIIEAGEKAGYRFTGWINWVKGTLKAPQAGGSGWGDIYGTAPFFLNGTEPILHFPQGQGPAPAEQAPGVAEAGAGAVGDGGLAPAGPRRHLPGGAAPALHQDVLAEGRHGAGSVRRGGHNGRGGAPSRTTGHLH